MIEAPSFSSPAIATGEGFAIRLLARIIDSLYGVLLGLGAGVIAGVIIVILQHGGIIAPGWEQRLRTTNLASIGLSMLGNFLYHALSEGIGGVSLGKLVCHLRVATVDGQPCGLASGFQRTLAYYFDALFFGMVGHNSMQKSPLNQRYGDVWAQTVVVSSKEFAASSPTNVVQLLAGLLVGTVCWSALLVLAYVWKVM